MDTLRQTVIAGIPICWYEPAASIGARRHLAIWLPGFSGTKESCEPQLQELAQHGFVALSFDPYQHGKRATESCEELVARILGNIRRHFWPILAHTAEDAPKIIDWAAAHLGITGTICTGGISMGGDISLAAAGIDRRIACVAACVATPDWLRPGSHEPPGQPDDEAARCYDQYNPLTHLERYRHCPAISFQCGALDTQVPPDGALRFADALAPAYSASPQRLQVRLHEGVGHSFTGYMWQNSLNWFATHANQT
jgi:dienelactone hydrolase